MCSQKQKPKVSEAEREVLEVLWLGPPHLSSELCRRLASRGWSETTVKTLVSRLVKKGFAGFVQDGNRYLYRPLITRDEYLGQETERFVDRWDDAAGFALLARFVEKTPLTAAQVEELKKLLEEKTHGNP